MAYSEINVLTSFEMTLCNLDIFLFPISFIQEKHIAGLRTGG